MGCDLISNNQRSFNNWHTSFSYCLRFCVKSRRSPCSYCNDLKKNHNCHKLLTFVCFCSGVLLSYNFSRKLEGTFKVFAFSGFVQKSNVFCQTTVWMLFKTKRDKLFHRRNFVLFVDLSFFSLEQQLVFLKIVPTKFWNHGLAFCMNKNLLLIFFYISFRIEVGGGSTSIRSRSRPPPLLEVYRGLKKTCKIDIFPLFEITRFKYWFL